MDTGVVHWLSWYRRLFAPTPEENDNGLEFASVLGKLVDDRPARARESAASDDAALLQFFESRRQDIGRYPRQPALDVSKSARADEEIPHDEQRPAAA